MRIFKNKQNKDEVKESAVVVAMPEVEKVEAPVAEKDKKEGKTRTVSNRKKNTEKTVCRVLVATPSYFVIDKNGEQITVNKKNNYHRNEEILY